MPEDKRQPITVYHGRWNSLYSLGQEELPHEVGKTFHAGTRRAALQRISDTIPRDPSKSQATIYKYELHPKDVSMLRYTDSVYRKEWGDDKRIKEAYSPELNVEGLYIQSDAGNKAKQYTNLAEDKGSTSYRIPSNLVSLGKVRHLGVQFEGYNPDVEDPTSNVQAVADTLGNDDEWWEYK